MVSRAKDTHTTNRVVRLQDDEWEDLGAAAGERHRAEVIRAFVRWYTHRPGAKRPVRPSKEEFDASVKAKRETGDT